MRPPEMWFKICRVRCGLCGREDVYSRRVGKGIPSGIFFDGDCSCCKGTTIVESEAPLSSRYQAEYASGPAECLVVMDTREE